MPTGKDFETVLAKYPELIEDKLRVLGRQVTVHGRRMDLLFEDRFGRQLITELKWGPIKDEHIGQLMSYEGILLSADDPSLRVMLIGTRVPPNIRRTLDHHGIAWKEISQRQISSFLAERDDPELAAIFSENEPADLRRVSVRLPAATARATAPVESGETAALFVPIEAKWLAAAFEYLRSGKDELYLVTDAAIGQGARLPVQHVYFKVKGEDSVCARAVFVDVRTDNPADKRLPGNENLAGRYYYGFRDLERLNTPVELTSLRRYTTGTFLRNDVPGACIIHDLIDTPSNA